MSGIVGIIDPHQRITGDIETIKNMIGSLTHRGPDDSGLWIAANHQVILGHRRLAILDRSDTGKQPMASADGGYIITFNGEIYNFPVLKERLSAKGYQFRSTTDTEILLYLYQEYKNTMVEMLDGDFAFGIYNEKDKTLFLARDRAGVKPLYYTHQQGYFIFASEVRTILSHPDITKKISDEGLYHYLTYLTVPANHTMLQDIHKLPAASWLEVKVNQRAAIEVTRGRYWLPTPKHTTIPVNEFEDQFKDIYQLAVKKRLMGDVPVGVFFSEGVDSSLNALSAAAMVAPEKIKTFSIASSASSTQSESAFAKLVAQKVGTEHHEVKISAADLISNVEEIAFMQDEPIADPVSIPLYFATKFARERGVSVLHSSEGADELFYGHGNYQTYLQQNQYWKIFKHTPDIILKVLSTLIAKINTSSALTIADAVRRLSLGQELFLSSAIAYYEMEKNTLLSAEFKSRRQHMDSFDIVDPFYNLLTNPVNTAATPLNTITTIELQLRIPELLLMRVDKMAMANSVECRLPYLDNDLIDFVLSVPDSFKLRDNIPKEPIKALVAKSLPRELVYVHKSSPGVPIHIWFKGKLGKLFLEMLNENATILQQYFDVAMIKQRLKAGPKNIHEGYQLWVIFNFVCWAKRLSLL